MKRIKLPHGDTDPRKRYSMPDPDALAEGCDSAYQSVFLGLGQRIQREYVTLSYSDAVAVLTLARGYLDLTMCDLGQEHCVDKLRDIWRARRARGSDKP